MLPIHGLVCPHCLQGALTAKGATLDCPECGAGYPVLGGVPVLFPDVELAPGTRPSRDVARQLLQTFKLPDDILRVEAVRQMFTRRARYGGGVIETEAAQFIDRARATGHRIDDPLAAPPIRPASTTAGGLPRYRWTLDYIPRRLPAGQHVTANLRFENVGATTMRHAGHGRVSIVTRWETEDGAPLPAGEARTALPIDVGPARGLTLPVLIVCPAAPGRYRLRLTMAQEDLRWLDDDSRTMLVRVTAMPPAGVPDGWDIRPEPPADYRSDHMQAAALLRRWINDLVLPQPRIVEIGGNVHPMIADCTGDLINVDVDLLGLQIGRLVSERNADAVRHLCADAENLPIADGSADVIAMFATLHHFPDPARLLARLRAKLRPGGFIGVFCEPVGHMTNAAMAPDFLQELRRGVNEQSFILPEYAWIFRQAGLHAAELVVDEYSLKARLLPVRP